MQIQVYCIYIIAVLYPSTSPLPVVQICYISETRGHIYKCMYVCAGALSVREEANVSTFFSFLLPFIEPPSGTPRESPQRTAMHRTHAHYGS